MPRLRAVPRAETAPNLDTQHSICIDCADPAVLSAFWSAVLGYVPDPSAAPDVLVDPAGIGPSIQLRQARDHAAVGGAHLDLEVGDGGPLVRRQSLVEAETARLVALGATAVGRAPGDGYGVVLTDPEGNELCVG